MSMDNHWSKVFSLDVEVAAPVVWQALADVDHWHCWNPGVRSIRLQGRFATGSDFWMELPDGEQIHSRLTHVSAPQCFIDETRVDDTVVRVEHRIEPLAERRCRVQYTIHAEGPQAEAFGMGVSADFPQVLAGLARYLAADAGY